MNTTVFAGQLAAPVAIVLGIVICFLGYRILKLTLAITGLILGAAGGWAAGMSIAPASNGIALACAIAGGILGAVLCVWLFYLGVFLVGVSAGTVVAAAVFGGTGHQAAPLLLLVVAVAFGILALLLQKFMIVVSTAFSGSYLVVSGISHWAHLGHGDLPLWFDQLKSGSASPSSYVLLAGWLILALFGVSFQYSSGRKREEPKPQETKPA